MQFKVDENLPVEVCDMLRAAGHDATSVLDQHLTGCADSTLAAICRQEGRALVTLDLDFSDIRTYPPADYAGLVVLRLRHQDKPHVEEVCTRMIALLGQESLAQRLWIVEEDRIRIRE